MATLINIPVHKNARDTSPILPSKQPLTKNLDKKCLEKGDRQTPIRSRKIVPEILNETCSSAWNQGIIIETATDDLDSNIISCRNYSTSLNEESVLISSQSSSSEIDSSSSSSDNLPENTCNCIIITEKTEDVSIKCSQYDQLLSPVSTTCQSLDDDSISVNILNNIRRREKKKKKTYLKFFCPPYFILAASLIEISVYIWGGEGLEKILVYSPHHRQQVWRFLSYMLLHCGGIHLTLNIIIQTLLATPLEFEQGAWRCAIVYLGGVLAGALGASVLQPTLYLVGASAGVYALLMSHLANVILRFSQLHYRVFRIFSVGVLALSDIAFSVVHWWAADSTAPRIGWAAHCAGAVAGAALGILVYTGPDKAAVYNKVFRWIAVTLLVVGFVTSVVCNIFFVKIP